MMLKMSVFFGCSIRNKVILTKFVKMSFQKQTVLKSFQVAFKGIFHMLRFERNFQIQIFALMINHFLIVIFKLQTQHAAIIILVCFSVLSAEIFNTAIERICDYIQPQYDKKIGFIKDLGAAAVTILSIAAVIIGFLIYLPYVL